MRTRAGLVDRVRRRPRGPPLRPAARLRRRDDQPVRRVRDARRHDPPGDDQAGIDHAEAVYRYRKAIKKGVVKVMSKMGISTIQSYRGAQIFEAIGLNEEFVRRYFDKTAVADRRRRPGRDRRRDALPPPPRLRQPRRPARRCSRRAASTSGAARASTTCSTPRPSSGSSTPPRPAGTTSSRNTPGWSTSRPSGSARSAACSTFKFDECDAGADRGGRAGRVDRQAVRHRRDELRLDRGRGARDPGHRHEPAGRPESTPAKGARTPRGSSRCPTATASGARSSRWPRAGSA